jgi:hypothetical protein
VDLFDLNVRLGGGKAAAELGRRSLDDYQHRLGHEPLDHLVDGDVVLQNGKIATITNCLPTWKMHNI